VTVDVTARKDLEADVAAPAIAAALPASHFEVEGVVVNCQTLEPTAERVSAACDEGASFGVFTLNLDHVVNIRRNPSFSEAYGKARFVTADGFPIVLAGRLSGAKVDRVTGADLIVPLCARAATRRQPVFLFGSSFEALAGAARHLSERCPGLEICGLLSPVENLDPTSEIAADYIREISDSGAKICFIALGAPKQEIFAARAIEATRGVGFVCIGAGLDYLSGAQVRAPEWAQKHGVEWLWRLLTNPRRLARRYLACALVLPSVLVSSALRRSRPRTSMPPKRPPLRVPPL
jgi:exopolysaccharide biosynthesis WecB/TagA/CpsF family protein